MEYDTTALNIIEGAAILEKDDFTSLTDMQEELQDVFVHSQLFRTRTEMEVSVLKDIKFPTPDAKYWQSVREQNAMFQNLVMLSYDYRKNKVEIDILKRDMAKSEELEQELIRIEIERKEFIAKTQEKEAKDRIREIREWHDIKMKLEPHLKHGTQDVGAHQLEAFAQRFSHEAAIASEGGTFAEKRNAFGLLESTQRLIDNRLIE